jgi:hypothetical protein
VSGATPGYDFGVPADIVVDSGVNWFPWITRTYGWGYRLQLKYRVGTDTVTSTWYSPSGVVFSEIDISSWAESKVVACHPLFCQTIRDRITISPEAQDVFLFTESYHGQTFLVTRAQWETDFADSYGIPPDQRNDPYA